MSAVPLPSMNDATYFAAEAVRLAALASYELLDSDADPALDALVRAAAAVCDAPIALITLLDADRLRFKANQGLPGVTEARLDIAFCSHTVRSTVPFEVPDAYADARFAASPLVTGRPHIRAYYGLPLRTAEGHILGTLCVCDRVPRRLDPTQRRALAGIAEAALALFEQRRQTLGARRNAEALDAIADEVLIVDGDTQAVRYANAAARRRLRSAATLLSALAGFEHTLLEQAASDLVSGAEARVLDGRIRLADGGARRVRVTLERLHETPPQILVQIAETAPPRSDARSAGADDGDAPLRELVDEVPGLLALVDTSGAVVFLNRRWQELTGRETGQLLGRGWLEVVDPAAREPALRALADAAAERKPFSVELPVCSGERCVTLLVNAVPRLDTEGRLHGYVAIAVDISAREEAYRSLRRSLAERTEELARVVGELPAFLLAAAHDLRAPLRAVSGYAEMLKGELTAAASPRASHAVSRIASAAADLDALLESLLRLTTLSRSPLRREHVPLASVVETAWRELVAEVGARDVELVVHALPAIECDAGLLTRAFANLLGNALKFTAKVPRPRIEVGALAATSDEVIVFVRDNGAGFEPDEAAQLFEPFRRFHRRDEYPGHGLGLAIVERIVNRHGGSVCAAGQPGRGATFYVSLPARGSSRSGESPAAAG